MADHAAFAGSVPRNYHEFLGPLLFEDFARDLAARTRTIGARRILELACGTGIVTRELMKHLPSGGTVTATDLNPAMLALAREVVGESAQVCYQAVDACTLPFDPGAFDLIVCQYGVMFFPDKIRSMRESRRVLTPGGTYVFNVWDSLEHNPIPGTVHAALASHFPADPPEFLRQTPYGWNDRAEIERVVRSGGFEHVSIETLAFPSVGRTATDVARGWLEGTPLFAALQERGVKDLAPLRQKVAGALAARFGDSPCRSMMQAIVVTAS